MKFIVDAQLPKKLSDWLVAQGYDATHTLDLPKRNLTEDSVIIQVALKENRTVITKDHDFFEHFILTGKPTKLLMVTAGNIVNTDLLKLFENNLEQIIELLLLNQVVELNKEELTVRF